MKKKTLNANEAIDWNCQNGIDQTNVSSDINQSPRSAKSTLNSPGVEWFALRLANFSRPGIPTADDRLGSQIRGQLAPEREAEVLTQEPTLEELLERERSMDEFFRRLEPTKPLDAKAQRVGVKSVLITWKPPVVTQIDGQGIVNYDVWRQEGDNIYTQERLGKTTNLSFLDNTAVRGKSYVYKVKALTKNSSGIPATTPPVFMP
jgi:hypothetical protein